MRSVADSYVISTRFTPEKGYLVESRRGSGGFVRIVRVTPPNKEAKRRETAQALLEHWRTAAWLRPANMLF